MGLNARFFLAAHMAIRRTPPAHRPSPDRRQVGTRLTISLFRKPSGPFLMGEVAREPSAGLILQVSCTPQPQRGGVVVVSGDQPAPVGAESGGMEIRTGKLRQTSASVGIPHSQ